jgi:hypothetical protein
MARCVWELFADTFLPSDWFWIGILVLAITAMGIQAHKAIQEIKNRR